MGDLGQRSRRSRRNGREGVVVRVLAHKGYGFLVHHGEAGLEEIFFHCTCLEGVRIEDLEEGRRVGFHLGRDRDGKGPKARLVWPEEGEDYTLLHEYKQAVMGGRGGVR